MKTKDGKTLDYVTVKIEPEEARALFHFMMVNDNPDCVSEEDQGYVTKLANHLGIRFGYDNWIDAYHNMG